MVTVSDCWWCTGPIITCGKAFMINRTAVDVAQPNTLECIPSPKTIDYTHELNNMDLIFI